MVRAAGNVLQRPCVELVSAGRLADWNLQRGEHRWHGMKEHALVMPRLVMIAGPAPGEVFQLGDEEITIGRDTANPFSIADSSLSRRHCAIVRRGTEWIARDLGSFNGTCVNGARVVEQPLRDGDQIKLGDTHLLFRLGEPEARGSGLPANGSDVLSSTSRLRLEDARYLSGAAVPDAGPHVRIQQDLQALVRIGTRINRIHDRQTLQRDLLDAAFSVVPATYGALLWIEAGDAEPQVAYTRSRDANVPVGISHTVIAQAVEHVEAILSKDAALDESLRDSPSIAEGQVSSVMAVPLVNGLRVAGIIYLSTSDPRLPFDDLHLEVVAALAGIGAVSLENVARLEWLQADAAKLKADLGVHHQMVGDSPAMGKVYDFIGKVGPTDSTVLVRGETGTGKELAARALHANSPRSAWPFLAINCAALSESLLESELFGFERGAFTGAVATKRGKLEVADRGTVFLDEVGELSPALQAKLLRVLQEREFERVGGTRAIKVDIRLISASNRDLEDAVRAGAFRSDLFFRLNVVTLEMPPLRSRRQDIPQLTAHFLAAFATRSRRRVTGVSPEARRCLRAYDWPGNVRELGNALERAVVLGDAPEIVPEDLPDTVLDSGSAVEPSGTSRFHTVVADAKRRAIREALQEADDCVTDAARLLGLHPNYLHRLLGSLKLRAHLRLKA